MGYSAGVIKPDGVSRHLEKQIFSWMETSGLKLALHKTMLLKERDIRILYQYCYGLPHYHKLEKFMMSGPVVFYVVSSPGNTVESLNRLVGSTDPKMSLKETIRGRYGENVARNVIHSTQNLETLKKDLGHFLTKRELVGIFL